ncbi:hypothetical protein [uncultured Megasphaera sp.]|uniref:hypothetical protein n=1 Tax=uncultured Megasphaera sp. TaxID=165188 RepID=UPI00204CFBF2|nr:hypothetical protein [uncultured Megasphaera sp.]DAZ54517.1 MAG TPA: hypothetical protein [Caudoviricetes sp.]
MDKEQIMINSKGEEIIVFCDDTMMPHTKEEKEKAEAAHLSAEEKKELHKLLEDKFFKEN